MDISNSTNIDIEEIFGLYKAASAYMQVVGTVTWPEFDRNMVQLEINENRQWKMTDNGATMCIWATTFNDPIIWGVKDEDPSIYIHRIATSPAYRGRNLVLQIVEWAKNYGRQNGKKYLRLDTAGNNKGLIKHYQHCGFTFLGLHTMGEAPGLPSHYQNTELSLFEMPLVG